MQKLITLILSLGLLAAAPLTLQAGDWELLGSRKVGFRHDRDVIHVGADAGRFSKIQLRVRRAGVRFFDVRVHFGNGEVQDIPIRRFIPAGGETRVIDLHGGRRFIRKVVFHYKTRRAAPRRAVVKLWGRH